MEYNNQKYSNITQMNYPNQIQHNIQVRIFFKFLIIKA